MSLLKTAMDNSGDIGSKIYKWCMGKNNESLLNIFSMPYNRTSIFLECVLNIIYNKGKVLYITNESEGEISFLKEIKKKTNFKEYCYYRNKVGSTYDKRLIFSNHINAYDLEEEFDLIIYDDISSYSPYSKEDIIKLLQCKTSVKYIVYSIEKVLEYGEILEYPIKEINVPFVEPRIISTRVDINKDMPYVMYDYLKWFITSNSNVVIYTPDEEKKQCILEYLKSLDDNIGNFVLDLDEDRKKLLTRVKIKDISTIAITSNMYNIPSYVNNLNIVVYFADHISLDYKKLIFICGKTGVTNGIKGSEVIFLANTISKDMDIAKDISRNLNKVAWENGYLNT